MAKNEQVREVPGPSLGVGDGSESPGASSFDLVLEQDIDDGPGRLDDGLLEADSLVLAGELEGEIDGVLGQGSCKPTASMVTVGVKTSQRCRR